MKKKVIISVLAMALVLCLGIGGTLAWLQAKTEPIVNTFTYGDINIELKETTGDTYKMIPGAIIKKDPAVILKEGSEACYLFVKVEKSTNFDDFMIADIGTSWTELENVDNVYWQKVGAQMVNDATYNILNANMVYVKSSVTKADLAELTEDAYPTLTFTAYAVQSDNVASAAEAWKIANAS